jgi:hypothetical protein
MEKEIEIIKKDLQEIKSKLNIITDILKNRLDCIDTLVKCSNKLDTHIDFVENTYDTLVQPLNYIKNTVNRISGYESSDLKNLKDK